MPMSQSVNLKLPPMQGGNVNIISRNQSDALNLANSLEKTHEEIV